MRRTVAEQDGGAEEGAAVRADGAGGLTFTAGGILPRKGRLDPLAHNEL